MARMLFMALATFSIASFAMIPSMVMAAQPPQHRAVRDSITLNFLLESCANVGGTARGKIPYFDCDSYIYGVLDAYLQEMQYVPKELRACFPEQLTPSQVVDAAFHIDMNLWERSAAPELIEMLRRKYPCA